MSTPDASPVTHVVIVGGGYVGIDAYRALMRRSGRDVRRGRLRVTVVNLTPYHTFHGFTGEVLTGILPVERTLTPLAELLPHAVVVTGRVTHADLAARSVTVQRTDGAPLELGYDQLLLGTGSRDPFERLPGLAEHGWRLKDTLDMQRFRTHLLTWGAELRTLPPARHDIAVIGGGFAGVEMAAALAELMRHLRRDPAVRRHDLRVHLLSGSPHLLGELRPRFARLADYAHRTLVRQGVHVRLNERVQRVTAQGVELASGEAFDASIVLLAAGVAFTPLPGTEALPRDARGRLLTDEYLRVQGCANVWAGGDSARVRHPATGGDCPANALWAMKHGMWAGGNIARTLNGRSLRRFTYRGLGQAASLGAPHGITELRGLQFTGLPGWLMRLGFFVWFMPRKADGARVLLDWMSLPFRRGRAGGERTDLKDTANAP